MIIRESKNGDMREKMPKGERERERERESSEMVFQVWG